MMNELNNFPSALKKYLDERKIKHDYVRTLLSLGLLEVKDDGFLLAMKDIEGNIIGQQERFFTPKIYGEKVIKSKTIAGGNVGYFFIDIDYSKPVIIVEGEIDFLSISNVYNVVGLQGVSNLKKLIVELKGKRVNQIYLLIDNDEPADSSIGKLLDLDSSFLSCIFDCRGLLGSSKDINDYIVLGGTVVIDGIELNKKSLEQFKKLMNKLITPKGKVDHNEFAQYLIDKLNIASVDGNVFMYGFDGNYGIWKPLSKFQIEKIIMEQLKSVLGENIGSFGTIDKNNIYDLICTHAEDKIFRQKLLSGSDTGINLRDCILDPLKLETRPYLKSDYKFQKFPYSYQIFDTYKEPNIRLKFLDDIFEGSDNKNDIIGFLQEYIGSLLLPDTKYQKALLFYGNGANGKGVLLSVIRQLLGPDNVSNIGLHEINNSQNIYNMFGKLANVDSDMQQDVQLDSGMIKKLVSGEPLTAKILYKQPIEYIPFVRLLIACNEQPYLKTIDNSIRRRFVYFHLKNSFYGKEDPDLIEKIIKEKENIFVWAVEGLCRLLSRGDFVIPKELTDDLDNFIRENDTVELFLDEGIVEKQEESKIYNKDLYQLYRWFCNDSGYKPLSQRNFNRRLRDKGFEAFRESIGRGFFGLRKNDPF